MSVRTQLRRCLYLTHRWLGVAGCVLMLLWFVSGVVMLFVGYPKLTPQERLALLPGLSMRACCASVPQGDAVALTSIQREPTYVVQTRGRIQVISALSGLPREAIDADGALQTVHHAQPDDHAYHNGLIHEDRWTHSRGLDPHRPLHRVQVTGTPAATYYVSSITGQIVLDAPVAQQRWNYVGAWLHWLYMLRSTSVDPFWTWTVIGLSAMCTLLALSGTLVGILRWRFRSRYRSGAHTPYRERWMRWHHVIGLCFSGFVCTWIFSGLMSMNPGDVFSGSAVAQDRRAYAGTPDASQVIQPRTALAALHDTEFQPVELQWRALDGASYVIAYDAAAASRIVVSTESGLRVQTHWGADQLTHAVNRLYPNATARVTLVRDYDAYYYARHSEAMNGGVPRGLPALRIEASNELAYIDMRTGDVVLTLSQAQRVSRWLFYFLHSWDSPAMLRAQTRRDIVLILLSTGGALLALTGIVLASRRLRRV